MPIPEHFEKALTDPFPERSTWDELGDRQAEIGFYIDWVGNVMIGDASRDELRAAFQRVVEPLTEIAVRMPDAIDDDTDAEADLPDEPEFELPGEIARDESPLTKIIFMVEGMLDQIVERYGACNNQNEYRLYVLMLAYRTLQEVKDERGREYKLEQSSLECFTALFDEFEAAAHDHDETKMLYRKYFRELKSFSQSVSRPE